MGAAEEEAWVTLATNDTYALGALVLAHSIRSAGTSRRLVALVTPGVTMAMRDQLSGTFDLVQMVNVLDSGDTANLALLTRPDLGVTFTKLHCWRLTQFSKCVFLDADTLMLHPCDELFDREELSAAPDAGWPDCFNSGVFVFKPSMETYQKLLAFAVSHGSFDGGDQGLLNSFFSDWATKDISRHLPFIYNMCSTATYSYLPAYKKFGETVRIAHFIGATKPWLQPFDSETRKVRVSADQEHQRMLLQIWWDIFCYHVHPHLSIDMRHRASLVPQLENSTPAHFVHNLFENFHPNLFEPHLSYFDEEEWWVQSNEPPSNPIIEQIACLPNLPRDDPPENLPCNEQPGKVDTDPSGGHSETPVCMEVLLEPQIPNSAPPAQPPSPQQSSVCLRYPTVTMVEEEAEREASVHSVENAGMPQCADPSPDAEGGLACAFSKMVLDAPKSQEQIALEDHLRRQAWEVGQIDYLGQDSFENIWKRIMQTLSTGPSSEASKPAPPTTEVSQSQPDSVPSTPQPAPPQPSPAPAPEAPPKVPSPPASKDPSPPPPKPPSPPKAAPAPKATPPPPIVPPSPEAPQMPLSPESTSPVQPSAPPPTPVKPTVPSPPPAAAPAKVAAAPATAPPPSPTKAAPPKAAAAAATPPPEEAAKGSAPVAPKRKGAAQQQQGGSGRGKSAGQKGKK